MDILFNALMSANVEYPYMSTDKKLTIHFTEELATAITLDQLRLLEQLVMKCSGLQKLDLSSSRIGNDKAVALFKGIAMDSVLQEIILTRCRVTAGAKAFIAEALKKNKTLVTLGLWLNSLGNEGIADIANALTENNTLTSIDLRRNDLNEVGAQSLCKMLKKNFALRELNLSANMDVKDQGMMSIVEGLSSRKGNEIYRCSLLIVLRSDILSRN